MGITLRTTTATTNGDLTITNKGSKLNIQEMDQNLIDLYNARVRIRGTNTYTEGAYNSTSTGVNNTAVGVSALQSNTTGIVNTAVGSSALQSNTIGAQNTAVGVSSLYLNTTGGNNTAFGYQALQTNTTGIDNVAIGLNSLKTSNGSDNTAVGTSSLRENTTGSYNTAVGNDSLFSNTTGTHNTAVGSSALQNNLTGVNNTAIGSSALLYTTGSGAGAGSYADNGSFTAFNNCTGLGYLSMVSGNNQVQLGGSGTSVYGASAYNTRSDIRDKADIRYTILGLDFIEKVRPVDFKWNYREDYFVYGTTEEEYTETKQINNPDFNNELEESESNQRLITITETKTRTISTREAITNDGSKTRNRYHHGVIAQEVKSVIDELGIDFGGFQDHKINGGCDVLTIGYEEFIAPMIKAIQELSEQNKALVQRIEVLESV